jgi:adenylate kinase family enzyme
MLARSQLDAPRRVAVIGCSGGGKSTLARKLGDRLGAPVVHLDVLFWQPNWAESDTVSFRARIEAATAGDGWIVDGTYVSRVGDLTLGRADTIVWVDQPRRVCLWRVLVRTWREWGRTRIDMAEGCKEKVDAEFLSYIWNWDRLTRPRVEAAIARHAPDIPLIRLRSDSEIAAFVAGA